ncbi:tail fiber domain-containing protein [Streptococcus mitis]|uniref:tail fiber domain-containing protein n=1 Tax=Streptococcus mitis TaxID=28037 RepID=UPI0039C054CB
MDALTRRQFDRAMFAKERTLAIRVGDYTSRDIKEAGFEYGYIKGDTYKPGGTCAGSGKITFTSIITTFNKLDILHPEIGLLVGNTYQWVKMGEYFINDIEIDRNRNTTTLELMDGMFKLNREYVTDLHFPAEVREVIQEICLKTGIELANDYFGISAMRYHVEQVPEGKKLSFRDMLSAMTQMIGMSCFFNREGKMEIRDLTESNITINADSYFLHGLTKSEIEYQIAGITCKTDKKSLTVGMKTGRSLELDNVFMTQSALNDLYYKIKNLTYYPYNLNYQGHLLLEVGQWVTIQTNKKETFKVPVLSQSFTFKGGLRGRISADSKAGNDTQYSYEGTITRQIKQQDGIEAKIQAQIEAADAAFDAEFKKRKKEIDDGIELAKAKAEEVKKELSDNIDQRFNSFNNGPLQEVKRRAEEALRNAGASSSLAQEAKRIGLDSVARLEAFKSQTTSAQTALSGDLDALKQTIANDIRPKQAQAEAEITKQVEALNKTKNELAGIKSAQATYEETTARRLAELTNLANGKASKSELTQTAEELASRIASVRVGGRNLYVLSKNKDISRSSHLTDLKFDISSGEISFKATGLDPYVGEATTHPKTASGRNGVRIPVIPGKSIYVTISNPVFAKNFISYFDERGSTVKHYQYYNTSSFVISPKELAGVSFVTLRFGCGGSSFEIGDVLKTKVKVEYGTIPTDWSPAPEDVESQISVVESSFKQRADALDAGVSRLTEGLRTKADISALNVTAENIRQSVKSLETSTQNKLDQKLSQAEFEVRAGSIRQEILNATKDKADKTLVVAEAGKLREEFSNLRVGGTNLLKGSKGPFLPDRKPANFDNNVLYAEQTSIYMEQGQEYIVSAKTDGTFTAHHDGNKESDNVVLWIMDKDVRNYQIVSDLKTGTTGTKIIWNKPTGIYHLRVNTYHKGATKSVWDVKIEKGNVATDWSPAPEDTDGLITEAKAIFERTAQGLRTDLSAIQEYVNKDGQRQDALQRYAREESAKQVTTIRELVMKDYVGKATYQETVRAIENKFEAITNPQNGSIATQIANYKKSVDGRFADITSLIVGKANQTDFQRVKETSQLYERIIGSNENDISNKVARMAMTNQLFQVEVGKAFAEHQNLFLTSTLTKGFLGNNGIINVANATEKEVTSDFISVNPNEKIIFQHWVTLPENGMAWTAWQFFDKNKNPIDNRKPGLNAYKKTVGKQHNINQITVPTNAYFVRFSARMYDDGLIKVEQGSAPSDYSVAPNDALEAVKTVQSQLAGSWAVQNINSAGDLISGINLGANGHNRFDGKLTHITGETLIDNAVIKSAMVDKLKTANFEAGSVTTKILDAEAVTADKVRFDDAFIRKMIANEAFINQLTSKRIFATKVESVVSSSTFLEAYQGRIGGFTLGQFDQGGGRWISGVNQFSVGMGNGAGYGVRTAFWANWGNNWNYAGPKAWNVNTDGKMYCRNEVGFYDQVDFSNASRANFYGTTTFSRSPVFSNGIELGSKDVFGDGSNPKGGRNAVVWWNQVGSGSVKYWMEQKSDRRLKENITDTAVKALDKINRLRMVAFDFVESKKHEEIGLIAQEAETIVPRIVSRDPENPDGYLHIDYTALVPYLIKAIQELNQKIEKMEKTIA